MSNFFRYMLARAKYAMGGCDFVRRKGTDIRICPVCGRREELDIYDGGSVNAWHVLWKGYPDAHFAEFKSKSPRHAVQPSGALPDVDAPSPEPATLAK